MGQVQALAAFCGTKSDQSLHARCINTIRLPPRLARGVNDPIAENYSETANSDFCVAAIHTEIPQILIEFTAKLNQVFCVFYENFLQI